MTDQNDTHRKNPKLWNSNQKSMILQRTTITSNAHFHNCSDNNNFYCTVANAIHLILTRFSSHFIRNLIRFPLSFIMFSAHKQWKLIKCVCFFCNCFILQLVSLDGIHSGVPTRTTSTLTPTTLRNIEQVSLYSVTYSICFREFCLSLKKKKKTKKNVFTQILRCRKYAQWKCIQQSCGVPLKIVNASFTRHIVDHVLLNKQLCEIIFRSCPSQLHSGNYSSVRLLFSHYARLMVRCVRAQNSVLCCVSVCIEW